MRFRKKMTAILLTAIFMISAFAIAMPVSAQVYKDFRDTEKIWGGDPDLVLLPNDDGLTIKVWYDDVFAYFRATIPECYNPETALTTFTFDVEPDGLADFQIQYDETGEWVYSEVDETNLIWFKDTEAGWKEVPSEFIPEHKAGKRVFTLQIPVTVLGGFESDYKFGVQANGEPSHQLFYSTDPAHLWYQTNDYVHSTYYVPMNVPTPLLPPQTKREALKAKGVSGEGIDEAPGLDKAPPNENFAKGSESENRLGPQGPNVHANERAHENARKHGHGNVGE